MRDLDVQDVDAVHAAATVRRMDAAPASPAARVSPITLHHTAYGRPALDRLRERIATAKAGDPLAPVTVVVPTNYVGVSARRLLAAGELGPITERGNGVAGLTLLTVYRLAELLGAPRLAASGRRPVSTPVVAAAIRRVLGERPGMFAPVAEHPSTEQALVRAYRELSELSESTLATLAGQSERAAEVVRIRRQARAELEAGWYEEADLMTAAVDAVGEVSPVVDDLGTVIVFLPQVLSVPAAGLLTTLAGHAPVEVIAGRTGADDADADIDRTLRLLGLAPPSDAAIEPATGTHIESVSDAEEEARSAVQHVLGAARDGVPLERMAVLHPADAPYARLLAEQLDAAGIAYNGRAVKPLSERLLGRWLLALLTLPSQRYSRPAVMNLLTSAPLLGAGGDRIPAGAWERVSRDAGIVHDRHEWHDKLTRLAGHLRHLADLEGAEEEPRTWLSERHRRQADQAEHLHRFTRELFDRIATAQQLATWHDLVDWCHETLRAYLGGDRVRDGWPEVERDAADRVEAALQRLASLDHVHAPVDLATFRRTLELELDDDLGTVGAFGQGVLVGPVSAGLGLDLDVVIVLGLAEGVLPTRPREDSLLPDAERAVCGDELRLRTDHLGVQHRHVLTALAAGTRRRVLVHPRGDLRRSHEAMPSRWLLDTARALDPERGDELPRDAAWHTPVASFAQRMRTTPLPATRQEYALRALADTTGRDALARHPVVTGDTPLQRGVELLAGRGRGGFSRFDGNIGELAAHLTSPAEADHAVSTTRLERWLACPHAYFMQHVLGVEPVENPEELLEIDAMERGSIVHDVLQAWLAEQLAGSPPAPHQPWPPAARDRLVELGQQHCADAERRGVTGHPLLWRRDRQRILSDLLRFADEDDARRAGQGLTPVAAEHPFGLPGAAAGPVAVELGDGRVVWMRGRIDRLDRTADGGLVVVDYKTGSASRYADLSESQPFGEDGSRLQLAVYGLAAGQLADGDRDGPAPGVASHYWFVSTRGEFALRGYPVTGGVAQRLARAVALATDGIAAGAFPPRPVKPEWRPFTPCVYCDPDDLGTTDRYRDWERVRQAAQLRDFVAHVEPDAVDAEPPR